MSDEIKTKENLQKQVDKLILDIEMYVTKIADCAERAVVLMKRRTMQSEITAMDILRSSDKYEKEVRKINDKIKKIKEEMEKL